MNYGLIVGIGIGLYTSAVRSSGEGTQPGIPLGYQIMKQSDGSPMRGNELPFYALTGTSIPSGYQSLKLADGTPVVQANGQPIYTPA